MDNTNWAGEDVRDNCGCFVKISNHVSDIQQGKLYCQPLKYFIDLENSTGQKGQGDKLEAQIPVFQLEYPFNGRTETISCTKTYSNAHIKLGPPTQGDEKRSCASHFLMIKYTYKLPERIAKHFPLSPLITI